MHHLSVLEIIMLGIKLIKSFDVFVAIFFILSKRNDACKIKLVHIAAYFEVKIKQGIAYNLNRICFFAAPKN
jgi:hypothetical protein